MNSDLHLLEEIEDKQDEYQAPICFQIDYELHLGGCCTVLEEVHDITSVEPISILMYDCCQGLVHYFLSHKHMAVGTHRDEVWVKGFFLLVSHEEQEAPTSSIDSFMVKPIWFNKHTYPFLESTEAYI